MADILHGFYSCVFRCVCFRMRSSSKIQVVVVLSKDLQNNIVQPDLWDVLGIIRRGWFIIALTGLTGLAIAMGFVSLSPPKYKASARMVIDVSLNRYMSANGLIDEPTLQVSDTWYLARLISSETTILPIVRALQLADDPEFVPSEDDDRSLLAEVRKQVRQAKGWLKSKLGIATAEANTPPVDPERIALAAVMSRLYVMPEGHNVISISFESTDPKKAAMLANAIADGYIKAGVEHKRSSTELAGKLMQQRLKDLNVQAAAAERALLEYKMKHNLLGLGEKALKSGQLDTLNERLAAARIDMVEAKAKLDSLEEEGGISATARFTPDNALISRLRTQHLDLTARATDIASRVGKNHVALTRIAKQQKDIKEAIKGEQKRLSVTLSNEYELAKLRYDELAATLAKVLSEESAQSEVRARARELASTAETYRDLRNSVLQRFGEINKSSAQAPAFPDARIVTAASAPFQSEASKKELFIILAGSLLGLAMGGAFVIGRELPFGKFRTANQVSEAAGLPCAILPKIRKRWSLRRTNGLEEYVIDEPHSRFAEGVRGIWLAIDEAQRGSDAKVFCIASSIAEEGKSMVATNLASHAALHANAKVLLIDADMHRKTLSRQLAPKVEAGLTEAIADPTSLGEFVIRLSRPNYDLLACPSKERVTNAAELLGSEQMGRLLDVAKKRYDVIIVEVPPVAYVSDLKMIARFCDRFIFVIEWGKTSQRLVLEILSGNGPIAAKTIYSVLNKAKPKALESIESYKRYGQDNHYYSGCA